MGAGLSGNISGDHDQLESGRFLGGQFDGLASNTNLPGVELLRQESVEVSNDPRIFLDNVIAKRLGAFETVAVAAILLASVSISTLLAMEENHEHPVEYVGLFLMNCVFVMNLFCVLVITKQYYQIFRLMTSGPTGFEIAKSYYLNQNIMTMRHVATGGFFYSIPMFIIAIACMIWTKLEHRYSMSVPMCVIEIAAAVYIFFVLKKHSQIFREKYILTKKHEDPLRKHSDLEHKEHYRNAHYISAGIHVG